MKQKHPIIKYLLLLFAIELVLNILRLIIAAPIRQLENAYIIRIVYLVIFILMLRDLYQNKVKAGYVLLAVILFPVFIQVTAMGLDKIFINFCPQRASQTGLLGLLNEFQGDDCSFHSYFSIFSYIEAPFFTIRHFLKTSAFIYLLELFLMPQVFYIFVFFKYCLFKLFRENHKNPYLSFIPVINNIELLKICKLPTTWIFILLVPFVRLFRMYKINQRLCGIQNIPPSNAIWLTLFPWVFYGKLVFRGDDLQENPIISNESNL